MIECTIIESNHHRMRLLGGRLEARPYHPVTMPQSPSFHPSLLSMNHARGRQAQSPSLSPGHHASITIIPPLTTEYEPCSWAAGSKPEALIGHSAVWVDPYLVVFAGGDGRRPSNDLHSLELATRTWRKVDTRGAPPAPRVGHSSTQVPCYK